MDKVQLTPTSIDLAAQTYFEIKIEFETWLQKEQFFFNFLFYMLPAKCGHQLAVVIHGSPCLGP